MDLSLTTVLLASVPAGGGYVDLYKIGAVVALAVAWAAGVQWIDRDTDVVKTKREQWNMIVMSGAFVGFMALFVAPWYGVLFLVGIAFWFLIAGGAMIAYIIHRNGRVVPAARVLTIGQAKRFVLRNRNKKKAAENKGQRILLIDHAGNSMGWPEDPTEVAEFEAVQDFLYDLLWRRASDAEMSTGKENYRLVYRIDGVATEKPDGVPRETAENVVRCLKRVAGLNVEEIRRPQAGTIKAALLTHSGEIGLTQVYTSGSTAGERLRLRIETEAELKRIHELGIHKQRLAILKTEVLGKSTGMLLASAPPHHGLTTTLYAVLRSHDAFMHNIHALERRPLIDLDNITQQAYEGGGKDASYARTLQTVLRREPDIVMVDQCDDRETALLAARAAVKNRKMYLGLHANDCFDALAKYLAFVGDNQLAAKSLRGVINQRLIRLLCTECREAFRPDMATLKKLNLPADKIERFYRPPSEPKRDRKGKEIPCPNCQGSRYLGRTAAIEVMVVDDALRKLIATGVPIGKIKAQARKNRIFYLQEEGLLKVIEGTTSMNEVLRCLRVDEKK